MYQLLKKDGIFYFSTQIGPDTLAFNAHRIFSIQYLLDLFVDKYELLSFSYIDDSDKLHVNVNLSPYIIANNAACKMGCGMFVMRKL